MDSVTTVVTTPDGQQLEVLTRGPANGPTLVYHGGTPSAAVPFAALERALAPTRLRLVTYSRPGYGASPPRAERDRPWTVADDVADTVAVLDLLGVGEFVTLGWSGGGPRAVGCAALVPQRCRAALSLAGAAPYDAQGLDFTAGMGPENIRDFDAAAQGATRWRRTSRRRSPRWRRPRPSACSARWASWSTRSMPRL